jgi:S1-C subfamily serine protease
VVPTDPNWVRRVAAKVRPSVVQITNEQLRVDQFNQRIPAPVGAGSGVVFDAENGYVLTNHHVVARAQRLVVALPDGRTFPGRLLGSDPETDLAVVQISPDNLPAAVLGDSGRLQVGDGVVAIGNALGLPGGPTVTAGVVSALGRSVQAPSSIRGQPGPYLYDLIQTDAAINPGNSGGPLVNADGEVVGINTLVAALAEPGVPAQGIGFAIAVETARPIAQQLVTTGRVVHPYMGIQYVSLNPSIAAYLGLPVQRGVLVLGVVPGSPASRAGLRREDVITTINDQSIAGESDLGEIISRHRPGDRVTLTVLRGGQRTSVELVLGEKPSA